MEGIFIPILYILLSILAFGFLVFIHELGHFLCARLCKVTVNEFSIGMGPVIFKWKSKKYNTQYSIRLLLIGGYVSMPGENEESDDPNSFEKKTVWQRVLITLAGASMNILAGILAMILVASTSNYTTTKLHYPTNTPDVTYTSQEHGLMSEDVVVKIGNRPVHIGFEMTYEIMMNGDKPVDVTVIRDGKELVVYDVVFATVTKDGKEYPGPDFQIYALSNPSFTDVIYHSFYSSTFAIKMNFDSIVGIFTGKVGLNELSGPIGVTGAIVDVSNDFTESIQGKDHAEVMKAVKQFANTLLLFFAMISMSLGIFNILPIPALDGGRLVFLIIEAIIRKPLNRKIEAYIHSVGFVLLFALIIVIAFKDVINLF